MKTNNSIKPRMLIWMAVLVLFASPTQLFAQNPPVGLAKKVSKQSLEQDRSDKSLATSDQKTSVDPKASVDEILDLDLEQLNKVDVVVPSFAVEVSSVTRNESTVGKSPAPVYVIDSEMIRRSTFTSLPELLRTVPGLNVSKIDSNRWAISSRGFNGGFSNKLLVLVDGRSIYSPVFSGVFWDRQDIMLENIEQIEVIRGPGASVWGANAVNGVINIISKHSKDTQGSLLAVGGGTEDKAITSARFGSRSKEDADASSNWSYRVYGKHTERGSGFLPDQQSADDWRSGRVGMRADWWDKDRKKQLMVQSEFSNVVAGTNVIRFPSRETGELANFSFDRNATSGHAMVRWTEQLDKNNDYKVTAYLDHREAESYYADQTLDIFNLEYQRNAKLLDHHEFSFGLGYLGVDDELQANNTTSVFDPVSRYTNRFSAFVQDNYSIVPDELLLLGGIKLEHNDYSGFEYQPTLRLLRMLDKRRAAWAAVSRAVRTPNRFESDLGILAPIAGVGLGAIEGNTDLEAENLTSFELGYRAQPTDKFSWDIAGYFNQYSDLILISPFAPPSGIPPTIPFTYFNQGTATVGGFELNASMQVNPCWQLAGWYSFNDVDFKDFPANSFLAGSGAFGKNNAFLRSSHCLWGNTEFDAYLRYVDNVPAFNASSYVQTDVRFGWRLSPNSRFSISATNLLDSHQFESLSPSAFERGTGNQRAVFAQFTLTR